VEDLPWSCTDRDGCGFERSGTLGPDRRFGCAFDFR
jgi:hypothetical protein